MTKKAAISFRGIFIRKQKKAKILITTKDFGFLIRILFVMFSSENSCHNSPSKIKEKENQAFSIGSTWSNTSIVFKISSSVCSVVR